MTQTQMTLAIAVVVGIVIVKWCLRSPGPRVASPMRARNGSSGSPLLWLIVLAVVLYFLWPHLGTLLPALIKQVSTITHASSSTLHSTTSHTTAVVYSSSSSQSLPLPQTNYPFYVEVARQAALDNQIEPSVFIRQINQESGFNPDEMGASGEIGIAQFMPETAQSLGINAHDPVAALKGAARLMASYVHHFGGDYEKALAAYNAGAGTVESAIAQGGTNWKAYIPASTRSYIAVILNEGA